jgi:hypothetical protein
MNANHYQLNQLYLNEMQQQAEQERLARLSTSQPNRLRASILAPLGRALVESGTHLLELSEQRRETVHTAEQMA